MSSFQAFGEWTRVSKLSVFLKKKEGVPAGIFCQYYEQKHAALAGPVLLRHNCVSYTQYHCERNISEDPIVGIFGSEVLSPQNTVQMLPYDVCSSFVFTTHKDAYAFFHDPETKAVLEPDSAKFADLADIRVAIGNELVVIRDGKPLA